MSTTRRLKPPKGTRDFYPPEMAVRRHVEAAWRSSSIVHGFEEIEGPMFEHLELYTLKSGEGIVNELFSFRRAGGKDDYALRPEFTPTLARMVAARGPGLPRPVKWFAIPSHFRAERPQRGRLREFVQWNVDMLGVEAPTADAEVLATGIAALDRLGLDPETVSVRLSHRDAVGLALAALGVGPDSSESAFELLDRRDKMPPEVFSEKAASLGLDAEGLAGFDRLARVKAPLQGDLARIAIDTGVPEEALGPMEALRDALVDAGLADWCRWDLGIVRGLAYYTGSVFEVHENGGGERAIAGGGRYDGLVELMGGPPTTAVGFGMGDVVLGLVLQDRGLLDGVVASPPTVVILSAEETRDREANRLLARLRRVGIHARRSYRTTRNVGKLLGDASKAGARHAVILGSDADRVDFKNLVTGEQESIPPSEVVARLSDASIPSEADGS
ncbi:MAG: histidine--tRNA ligase [Planctomycetota bacterium]|nr:histidine--tRNA ligase [Planctomycetota bacterium]